MKDFCVLCNRELTGKRRFGVNYDNATGEIFDPTETRRESGFQFIGSECRLKVRKDWVIREAVAR